MEGNSRLAASSLCYFSESKGRILSEEERAKETVYIQKMEREKMEKLKKKAEKEKATKEKADKIAPIYGLYLYLLVNHSHFYY
ncbi:hypothetical protein ACS0TY_005254 [Phlomoides rotata]